MRAERVAQLTHEHGRRHSVARDVANRDMHDAVGAPHRVVPVAADLETRAARVVAADQLHALDLRELLREQAALKAHGDLVLALEG